MPVYFLVVLALFWACCNGGIIIKPSQIKRSQIKLSRPIWDRAKPGTSLPGFLNLNTPNRFCYVRLGGMGKSP